MRSAIRAALVALTLVACTKERIRPKYGDPCEPPRPGCFYLGDEFSGVPMVEVFDTTPADAAATKRRP